MAGPAWKGQGRQFVQSTRMSVRLGGAAAETTRPPKLNSRIMVTQLQDRWQARSRLRGARDQGSRTDKRSADAARAAGAGRTLSTRMRCRKAMRVTSGPQQCQIKSVNNSRSHSGPRAGASGPSLDRAGRCRTPAGPRIRTTQASNGNARLRDPFRRPRPNHFSYRGNSFGYCFHVLFYNVFRILVAPSSIVCA